MTQAANNAGTGSASGAVASDNLANATRHVADIVNLALERKPSERVVVVYDTETELSRLLAEAYRTGVPGAEMHDRAATDQAAFFAILDGMQRGDVMVLIQSTYFQYSEFRIRIELFQRGLKVVEHMHLVRAADGREVSLYVDGLAYDPAYYRPLGAALKKRLDAAQDVRVHCGSHELVYGPMAPAKLNVGDYTGMTNVGGTFPIGEVFTEAQDLEALHGSALIFGFANTDHHVRFYEPFPIYIENGVLVRHEGPEEFEQIIRQIAAEEQVLVREFGLGLNPAFSQQRPLTDITAFERQLGLHFSLGEKHGVMKKPGFNAKKTRYHIDVFVAADRITCDGEAIYDGTRFMA